MGSEFISFDVLEYWQMKFVAVEFIILDILFIIYAKTQRCQYIKQLKVDGKTFFLKINVRLLLALSIWKLVSVLVLQSNFAVVNRWSAFLMIALAIPLEIMSFTRCVIENLLCHKIVGWSNIPYRYNPFLLMFLAPFCNTYLIAYIVQSTKINNLFVLDIYILGILAGNIYTCKRQVLFHKFGQLIFHNYRHFIFHTFYSPRIAPWECCLLKWQFFVFVYLKIES